MIEFSESPVTTHQFNGVDFHLKRDDLLHPQFSGNKARKFSSLLSGDFPDITTLISYGSAQANSLYSFAALCALRHWRCEFYVHHIPQWLVDNPNGNYKAALELGAHIIDVSRVTSTPIHPRDYIQAIRQPNAHCLVVPEGGRSPLAEKGIRTLAEELLRYITTHQLSNVRIVLPSGTGTTALYLNKYLTAHQIEVITCPCVGDNAYLIQQFQQLGAQPNEMPTVWTLPDKHHFGKLYKSHYDIWRALHQETGVEFDLLYDPVMWLTLMQHKPRLKNHTLIYIHQGGLLGNQSMLRRYQRKWP